MTAMKLANLTDWQTADVGTFRRAIAERLGYTTRLLRPEEIGQYVPFDKPIFKLVDPSGVDVKALSVFATPDRAFDHDTPDWLNDARAALALPLGPRRQWEIIPSTLGWWVIIVEWRGADRDQISDGVHKELAVAACIAWLYMKDMKLNDS
jgi:hypothetical protein